jgi:hypothetical protein
MLDSTKKDFLSLCVLPIGLRYRANKICKTAMATPLGNSGHCWSRVTSSHCWRVQGTVSENMMGRWKNASRQSPTNRHNTATRSALNHSSEHYSQTRGTRALFISSPSVTKSAHYDQRQEYLFAVSATPVYFTANTAQFNGVSCT